MPTLQNASGRKCSPVNREAYPALFLGLGVCLVCVFFLSLFLGSTKASILTAVQSLQADAPSADYWILFYIRLPRAIGALLAGAALAVSGVLIQGVLNNPMAAPNLIGVNSGAGLAAVVTISLFPSALAALPWAAFFGALAACLLIYTIASKSGAGKLTITLVGISVGSVLNAAINTVKVLFPDSVYDADVFMIGGFSGITYGKLFPACIIILAGLLLAFFFAKDTDVLSLGEMTAASLGIHLPGLRLTLLVIASCLAGAAVSFAGLLGFVGLLVPHIVRRFLGNRHRLLIPGSALLGSLLVLSCDLFSRVVFAPYELPVGIVLSLLGGSFFILLVLSERRKHGI